MKKIIATFVISFVGAVVLIGCAQQVTPSSVTAPAASNQISKVDQPPAQSAQDEVLDETAMNEESEPSQYEIQKKMDCKMLKDSDSQKECDFMVNDMITSLISSRVYSRFDLEGCGVLPDNLVEQCKDYITKTGIKGPISQEDIIALNEAVSPIYNTETAEDMGYDTSKCDTLTVSGLADYCRLQINQNIDSEKFMSIVDTGSVSDCDQMLTERYKQECQQIFNIDMPDEEDQGSMEDPMPEEVMEDPIMEDSAVMEEEPAE